MKKTKQFCLLLLCILSINACKKDEKKNKDSNADNFFIEGRGLRKIHEVNHPSAGNFSGFGSSTMMLSGQTLDWVFAWYSSTNASNSYVPYRLRINIANGDTMANPGLPKGNPAVWYVSPDKYYMYANASNQLCWRSGSSGLVGEAANLPYTSFGDGKVYGTDQIFSYNATSAYNGFSMGMHSKPVSANFLRNGIKVDTNYLIRNNLGNEMIRCMDMEMTLNNEILMFVATGDSIQVRRFRDNVVLAGVPCAALSATYTDYATSRYCDLTTRRSLDGQTVAGHINNYRVSPSQTTSFVYNTITNKLELKINALAITEGLRPINHLIVFDDNGNVYYQNEPKFIAGEAYGGITKQTPSGNTVLCERFLKVSNASIDRIYAIGNKLFALLLVGENTNAASGSKNTTYLLTVAE